MISKKANRSFRIATIGGLAMILAIFFKHYLFQAVVYLYFQNKLYLYPGSEVWEIWKEPPIPIETTFHFFNVTNPDEIRDFGAKPILEEVGPYTYSQWLVKHDITLNDDATVTYFESKTFHFEPDWSQRSEDDVVTILNYPLVEAVKQISLLAEWKLSAFFLNYVLKNYQQELFVTKTVRELLFGGYHDLLLSHGQLLIKDQLLVDDKFSYFSLLNGTKEGPITIRTGEDDIETVGRFTAFKGSPTVSFWKNKYCNMMNGTDGMFFHPFVNKDERLYAFLKEFGRSFYAEFIELSEFEGVPTYRFTVPPKLIASASENPDNECYCYESSINQCPKSGLIDVFPSVGAHILLSEPHFFRADKSLLRDVDGLSPSSEKHMSYFDLQPELGYPLLATRKVQMNAELKPFPHLEQFRNVPTLIFPMFWMSEEAKLSPSLLSQLKLRYMLPKTILEIIYWIGLVAGAAMIILGVSSWKWASCPERAEVPLLKTSETKTTPDKIFTDV